jgi:hypothetical protein
MSEARGSLEARLLIIYMFVVIMYACFASLQLAEL